MSERQKIEAFLAERTIAIVGMSRTGGFSRSVWRELEGKGRYRLIAVNPEAEAIGGEACYPSLQAIPERVGAALALVPKAAAERVVRDAAAAAVRRVWLQQGCETPEALRAAAELGVELIHGRCILMFADPVRSVHGFHRFLMGLLRRLPA